MREESVISDRRLGPSLAAAYAAAAVSLSGPPAPAPASLVWGATRDYPRHATLHGLIAAQASRTPDAVAVEDERTALTYAELERRANALAVRLAAEGVRPGDRVGVCLDRSAAMVAALLAVLKTGAAYVPLDPAYPAGRLAYMVEDAGCAAVLTEASVRPAVPTRAIPAGDQAVILLDAAAPSIGPQAPFPTAGSANGLAYVIYTSGSTGRPKGVEIEHRSVVNLLYAMQRMLSVSAEDRILAITTISFDISVLEMFLPLLFGARVVVASRADATDASRLAARLKDSGATMFQATPVTWRLLLAGGWRGQGMKLLCGGEAADPALARLLVARGGRFWNVYGPTETTIWSTAHETTLIEGTRTPIGRPLDNTGVYVLDAEGRPVRGGEVGEIHIGGDGLARGYLGRPEQTAERFLADPFAGDAGARMYRTGDLGRVGPDGALEFCGRADHQVKVRGFRIELGEIEAVLGEHPEVRQAVIVPRTDPAGDDVLVAFVAPASRPFDVERLRRSAEGMLPAHMRPGWIFPVEAFPLTPAGKVDRAALLALVPRMLQVRRPAAPPRDAIEAKLVAIFEQVLAVRPVGIDDDFFDLGGTSLSAVRAIGLIGRRLGRQLHVNTLYHRRASVAHLAELLRASDDIEPLPYLIPLGGDVRSAETPIFCLPTTVEGTLFFYRDLAKRLNARAAFFGVLPRGLEDHLPADASLAAMAAHSISVMRGLQPHGPYRLLGFSSAGVLALEVARQLKEMGETVGLLGLIDAYPPVGRRTPRYYRQLFVDRLRRLGPEVLLQLRGLADRGGRPHAIQDLRWRHRLAVRSYRPRPYPGHAVLFAAENTTTLFREFGFGWGRLVKSLDYSVIPGGHFDIAKEPAVGSLATLLEPHLDPAEARRSGAAVARVPAPAHV